MVSPQTLSLAAAGSNKTSALGLPANARMTNQHHQHNASSGEEFAGFSLQADKNNFSLLPPFSVSSLNFSLYLLVWKQQSLRSEPPKGAKKFIDMLKKRGL
ncbi:hypothetical protein ACOSQ2_009398 [Xanthoceras sorbifolium]